MPLDGLLGHAARGVCVALLSFTLAPAAHAAAGAGNPEQRAIALIDAGHFQAAETSIARALKQPELSADTHAVLLFQRDRMRRIRLDFTLSADQVKAQVRAQIPQLTDATFARWNAAGLFEHLRIDGHTLYFKRSPSNLFRLSAEALAARVLQAPLVDSPMQTLNSYHRAVRAATLAQRQVSVMPQRVRVTQSLSVHADAVPAGETISVWIPYPQELRGQQEDLRLVDSTLAQATLAPATTLQRTVHLEKPAQAGVVTRFSITYELTIFAQYHVIDPGKVVASTLTPELAPYVAERPPHIVFTDALRGFSRAVVGNEKNPYRIAQKLFAAVDKTPWAGAREYATISNISDYALHAGHADCGQQTLLLMTLLRLNGIPARWQSGWIFSDGTYNNLHDWGQLYLAPYGWIPMDVTFGRLRAPTVADTVDSALEWFYLGGLDAWRIAFNDDYARDFVPPKTYFRSDNVDSQRGEVEWKGGNLYYDQWDYDFQWQMLPLDTPAPP